MSRNKIIIVIIVVVIVLLLFAPMYLPLSVIPHGYDGVTSNMASVEHDYEDVETLDSLYYKGINPRARFDNPLDILLSNNPTGIRCSISAPQFLESEDLDPINSSKVVYVDGVQMVEETTTQVSIMKFEMSATLQTYIGIDDWGGDTQPIYDVKFWIQLQNNLFSVFGADESAIAILSVRTQQKPVIAQLGDDIDFEPKAGGTDLALYSVEGTKLTNIPDSASSSYNIDNLRNLQIVEFAIDVIKADPAGNTIIHPARLDCQVDFTFDIEVLLFGMWTQLRPYVEYEPPDPDMDLIDEFWLWLESLVEDVVFFGLVIVGIALTIVVLIYVPNPKYKLAGAIVVWAGVGYFLGWYDMLFDYFAGLT